MDIKQIYRRLNAHSYENYDDILEYLRDGNIPETVDNRAKERRFRSFFEPFYAHGNNIICRAEFDGDHELNLRVLRDENVEEELTGLYARHGLGHGINQFYDIVSSRFLNVSRKQISEFLKRQLPYQLTRVAAVPKNPTKKFIRQNQAWAIDLIDMSNLGTRNAGWNWILSCQDLYSKRCWLRKLRNKTAEDVLESFAGYCTEANKPRLLMLDNGREFQSVFRNYCNQLNIKMYHTLSHSAQPHIENLNGQIRKMIAELAVRQKNLVWHTHLATIETNLNNYNALTKNRMRREAAAEGIDGRPFVPPVQPKFAVGDRVRVQQKAFVGSVREKYKAGLQKEVYVKWSVYTYIITKVIRRNIANSFYSYNLRYMNGNDLTYDGHRKIPYRESDLMLVPAGTVGELTLAENALLNREPR